jgi:hypothetical protein
MSIHGHNDEVNNGMASSSAKDHGMIRQMNGREMLLLLIKEKSTVGTVRVQDSMMIVNQAEQLLEGVNS